MEVTINGCKLKLVQGDITKQDTDVIVNAANSSLLGGGGVDGAIHRAGGPEILEECKKIKKEIGGYLPTGEAVITTAGKMPSKKVIHTVGPIYGRDKEPERLLANAYRNSLKLCLEKGYKTISFPSISTGAYGYPIEEASIIALKTVIDFLNENKGLQEVRFVLFSDRDLKVYENSLKKLLNEWKFNLLDRSKES